MRIVPLRCTRPKTLAKQLQLSIQIMKKRCDCGKYATAIRNGEPLCMYCQQKEDRKFRWR